MESIRSCEKQLINVQTQLETAKNEVDRPFSQEQEYTDKTERLKEVNILLNMDQKDHEIFDMEPDGRDRESISRTSERAR